MMRPLPATGALALAAAFLAVPASVAGAQCLLCAPVDAVAEKAPVPLSIEIDAALDFPRATVGRGGGRLALGPTGSVRASGDMTALGGLAMHGSVLVRGEPGRLVRVTLPERVILRTSEGVEAELGRLESDLPPAPRLGADGMLRFQFGGELAVAGDGAGDYRGRIPITVDYL